MSDQPFLDRKLKMVWPLEGVTTSYFWRGICKGANSLPTPKMVRGQRLGFSSPSRHTEHYELLTQVKCLLALARRSDLRVSFSPASKDRAPRRERPTQLSAFKRKRMTL